MKRNSLTTAVIAGVAGLAGIASQVGAVDLNPDGLGQVLIYPYYTVNGKQQTLLSVVNTTDISKAVKVRFLEGHNSREVLDFNLFLSPFDVWTASVFGLTDAGLTGDGAAITTSDKSCVAPDPSTWTGKLPNGAPYQNFLNYAYTGTNADTGPSNDARTREGHIELISMADIVPDSDTDVGVTHVNGVPFDCSVAQNPPLTDLVAPTSGLFGAGGIVNVAQGTFYTYNADAVDGFTQVQLFSGTASLQPSLAQANNFVTDPTQVFAYVFQNGRLVTTSYSPVNNPVNPNTNPAIDAVSAVFASDAIFNEYNVDAASGSNTDWVVTFPTKRFYVDKQIIGNVTTAIRPFVFPFGQNVGGNGPGLSCVQVAINIFNREEGTPSGPSPGFSPPPPGQPPSSLCKEANVISFLNTNTAPAASGVLASTLVTNIKPFGSAGWLRLGLNPGTEPHFMRPGLDGDVFNGLPVTGFEAVNYVNANVTPGVLSNYSGLFRHRAERDCVNGALACS